MTNLHNFYMHFHLEHAPWRGTPPCKRRPWTCGWVASDFEPCKFAGYAYPANSWTQRPSLKRIHVFPFFTWQWNIHKSKVAKLASRDWRYTPRKLNPRHWSQQRARTRFTPVDANVRWHRQIFATNRPKRIGYPILKIYRRHDLTTSLVTTSMHSIPAVV